MVFSIINSFSSKSLISKLDFQAAKPDSTEEKAESSHDEAGSKKPSVTIVPKVTVEQSPKSETTGKKDTEVKKKDGSEKKGKRQHLFLKQRG